MQSRAFREEGFFALWKGNSMLTIRIFPYSAAQLAANDTYKRVSVGDQRHQDHKVAKSML